MSNKTLSKSKSETLMFENKIESLVEQNSSIVEKYGLMRDSDMDESQYYDTDNSNAYVYNIVDYLQTDLDDYLNQQDNAVYKMVYICAYNVNSNGLCPFIQYMLYKEPHHSFFEETMKFPYFAYVKDVDIKHNCRKVLDKIFTERYSPINNSKGYQYKGFINTNDDIYMFYDCSAYSISAHELPRNATIWFALIDEIVNHKHMCNFPIDDTVSSLFLQNPEFIFLNDMNNNHYDIPLVAYTGNYFNKIDFQLTFGQSKAALDALLGPYYYFTDYNNAIKQGGWTNTVNRSPMNVLVEPNRIGQDQDQDQGQCKYVKGGIIRYAIFPQYMKVKLNMPEDPCDESEITMSVINAADSNNYNNYKQRIRLSDRDGLWVTEYDSIYIGPLELDNGEMFKEGPMWVLKNHEQQLPLTSHFIDKRSLGDEWSNTGQYYIA